MPNCTNRGRPLKDGAMFVLRAESPSGTAAIAANYLKMTRCFVLRAAPL